MKQDKKFVRLLWISGGAHLFLFIALILGSNFSMPKSEPTPNMIQAVAIDKSVISEQAQQIRAQREAEKEKEAQRIEKLRKESEQLEKNRKAEEERIRRLNQQKSEEAKRAREAEEKRILAERQAKAEAERKKKEQEERQKKEAARKAEEQRIAKEKAAQEAERKKSAEQAAKAEAARIAKEKAAKEKAEQEAALNDLFSGLEQENQNNSAAQSQFVADETARYGAIYTQMIQEKLLVDDSYIGKECRVDLKFIATGSTAMVSSVKTVSGDRTLCSATKRAIAQVNSFPLPKDSAVAEKLKNIRLTVAPE